MNVVKVEPRRTVFYVKIVEKKVSIKRLKKSLLLKKIEVCEKVVPQVEVKEVIEKVKIDSVEQVIISIVKKRECVEIPILFKRSLLMK